MPVEDPRVVVRDVLQVGRRLEDVPRPQVLDLLSSTFLNLSLCLLKQHRHSDGAYAATKAIELCDTIKTEESLAAEGPNANFLSSDSDPKTNKPRPKHTYPVLTDEMLRKRKAKCYYRRALCLVGGENSKDDKDSEGDLNQ